MTCKESSNEFLKGSHQGTKTPFKQLLFTRALVFCKNLPCQQKTFLQVQKEVGQAPPWNQPRPGEGALLILMPDQLSFCKHPSTPVLAEAVLCRDPHRSHQPHSILPKTKRSCIQYTLYCFFDWKQKLQIINELPATAAAETHTWFHLIMDSQFLWWPSVVQDNLHGERL